MWTINYASTQMVLLTILLVLIWLFAVVAILMFTAAFTLVERKLMGLYQRREGPDRVGFEGLGQPFADGLKLIRKETLIPKNSPEHKIFFFAPIISLSINIILWLFIPFSNLGAFFQEEIGLLFILGISSLGSYGVIYAGWASNNKYALLGALRGVAQFISYEIIFSILFLPVIAATGTANLSEIVYYQFFNGWFFYFIPIWAVAFIVVLAETNRTPFDLPEAEAELVSGFNVEYSSLLFAFFFLAEYSGMGFFSALLVSLFFGGWSFYPFGSNSEPENLFKVIDSANHSISDTVAVGPSDFFKQLYASSVVIESPSVSFDSSTFFYICVFAAKVQVVCLLLVFIRAAQPRYRFDQLIQLCWKYLFPLTLALAIFTIGIQYSFVLWHQIL